MEPTDRALLVKIQQELRELRQQMFYPVQFERGAVAKKICHILEGNCPAFMQVGSTPSLWHSCYCRAVAPIRREKDTMPQMCECVGEKTNTCHAGEWPQLEWLKWVFPDEVKTGGNPVVLNQIRETVKENWPADDDSIIQALMKMNDF